MRTGRLSAPSRAAKTVLAAETIHQNMRQPFWFVGADANFPAITQKQIDGFFDAGKVLALLINAGFVGVQKWRVGDKNLIIGEVTPDL